MPKTNPKQTISVGKLERYTGEGADRKLQQIGIVYFKRGKTGTFLNVQVIADCQLKANDYIMLFPNPERTFIELKKGILRGI